MLARSWIAVLLLINYLLLVGMGCIIRPDGPHDLVLVQTSNDSQYYQPCRYLRMDGLDAFLAESLASRYQDAPRTPQHHLITVVLGVDTHCLPYSNEARPLSTLAHYVAAPAVTYQSVVLVGIDQDVYSPPWLG